MNEEIKPCPFCTNASGIKIKAAFDNRLAQVVCTLCCIAGPQGSTRKTAIEAWNSIQIGPQAVLSTKDLTNEVTPCTNPIDWEERRFQTYLELLKIGVFADKALEGAVKFTDYYRDFLNFKKPEVQDAE